MVKHSSSLGISSSSRSSASTCAGVRRGSSAKSRCAASVFLRLVRAEKYSGWLPKTGQR
jgi:hypothetical protein